MQNPEVKQLFSMCDSKMVWREDSPLFKFFGHAAWITFVIYQNLLRL